MIVLACDSLVPRRVKITCRFRIGGPTECIHQRRIGMIDVLQSVDFLLLKSLTRPKPGAKHDQGQCAQQKAMPRGTHPGRGARIDYFPLQSKSGKLGFNFFFSVSSGSAHLRNFLATKSCSSVCFNIFILEPST